MPDVMCTIMGGIDILAGLIIFFSFSNVLFTILGIVLATKGVISFLG
jgi:hypothetical protein